MTTPAAQPEQTTPPPEQDQLVRDVAALILAGGAATLLAALLWRLMRRRGRTVTLEAVTAAVMLTDSTATQPRMVGRSDVARAQRHLEAYYRAAYIIRAAERITGGVMDGRPLREVVRGERRFLEGHQTARRARMVAAAAVAAAMDEHGPLLGWHGRLDGAVTPECRAADGTNFSAADPPLIGWPGTLHGGRCRCEPGAPFPGAQTTNQALRMRAARKAV